jgi:hypothetical protein
MYFVNTKVVPDLKKKKKRKIMCVLAHLLASTSRRLNKKN